VIHGRDDSRWKGEPTGSVDRRDFHAFSAKESVVDLPIRDRIADRKTTEFLVL